MGVIKMKKSSKHTRRHGIKVAISTLSAGLLGRVRARGAAIHIPQLTSSIPIAPAEALTGMQFAATISDIDRHEREAAILDQLLKGNLPCFLRKLAAVKVEYRTAGEKNRTATVFVMPEYLAIGDDRDFLRIPMNLHTAVAVADHFGFLLPTRKMVDAIYNQAAFHLMPQPLPAGPRMTSTEYYRRHNAMIDEQFKARHVRLGSLISGHKKDVVVSNRLISHPGQIAIYGWHRDVGDPIQPLSTVHGAGYADYSHGIRLVGRMALVEGELRPVAELLLDPEFARVLSDEGPISLQSALGRA
jgi:hypothetical protein